ncbi:c-type cytochrome [Methylobacterium planeticum]|uniref:C-type cytochrome n=1 Tax=Methylobacterium planeticum TaxID=2615211 RepID=A0A6N6MQ12_9HYPH|nr:c-type cytochrome [Methylobacterium planeticum]KAB1072435.1 c-type cytochrome [Methylobacterium planeticum]
MRRLANGLALCLLALTGLPTGPAGAQPVAERLPACLGCHGGQGRSETEGVPSLGGMPADYVLTQLYLFREKQRVAPPMNEMAAGLSDDDLRTISDAVAALPPPTSDGGGDPARIARAKDLVARHQCGSCHNADFSGHDQIPRIRAQREEYLVAALRGYKSNARAGYDPAMNEAAQPLSDDDIRDLAHYLAHP